MIAGLVADFKRVVRSSRARVGIFSALIRLTVIALLAVSPLLAPLGDLARTAFAQPPAMASAAAPHDHSSHDHGDHDHGGKPGAKSAKRDKCDSTDLKHLSKSDRCTHGPDPVPPGLDIDRRVKPVRNLRSADGGSPSTPAAVLCDGDGVSGNRVQVIYARASDVTSRYNTYLSSFRAWAAEADQIFQDSAAETGGSRRVRYVTDANCDVVVLNVTLTSTGDNNFDNTITELENQGHNRTDRIYMIFVDTTSAGICGIGTMWGDDRSSSSNWSNRGPSYGRTDAGCWDGAVAAHELMHNLGGVQNSAPNSSGGGHCVDEYDRMCYSDYPNYPQMQTVCGATSHDVLFDCRHDDYFHTNPAGGSYLATHWNTANNGFLTGGASPPPCPDAATEPDNSAAQARSFTVGATETHTFCTPGDVDWVRFAATAGTTYRIETRNLAAGVDTILNLLEPDGTTPIDSDDDSNGNRASLITFTPSASGTYYLWAEDYSGSGSAGASYDLRITIFTTPPALALSPSSGNVGRAVEVTLSGFPASSSVSVQWDGVTQTTATASAGGDATASFIVPAATAGDHTVTGIAGAATAERTFTVNPSLTLSPESGPRGQVVGVTLDGYAAGERVTIFWYNGKDAVKRTRVTVSADGAASTTITVPRRAARGSHKVQGTGSQGNRASATFDVTNGTAAADTGPPAANGGEPAGDGDVPAADSGGGEAATDQPTAEPAVDQPEGIPTAKPGGAKRPKGDHGRDRHKHRFGQA
jgi:hypothetical protein